jgi:hypothetical protein
MSTTTINQSQAIALLKENKSLVGYEIRFDSTHVEALDVLLLGKAGIQVPPELIYYDDDSIDFSDDPDLTDEDIASGKIRWKVHADLSLEEDVRAWVEREKIDLNVLLSRLLTAYYRELARKGRVRRKVV